jgi:copper chaperone CopZ
MSTLRFKTTINCASCIRAVTPVLNQEVGASNWQVDTANPNKILTVEAASANVPQLVKAIQEAGFSIEPVAQ